MALDMKLIRGFNKDRMTHAGGFSCLSKMIGSCAKESNSVRCQLDVVVLVVMWVFWVALIPDQESMWT